MARHADNPRIADVMRDLFPNPYALSDAEEFIAKTLRADPLTAFAIVSDKEAFGVIGYWIGEEYWGRGIMTGVIEIFTAHLFENFDFKRLSAGVFSSNPASARVLEKAGFTLVATLRAHVTKNGEVFDELLYSKLRPGLVG